MKISTKGRYALRMMVDLAQNREKGFISLKEISERQHISKKYLEQIVPAFHNSRLLMTGRGSQGGYRLAKAPGQITVGDILRQTEGSLAPVACLDFEPAGCDHRDLCPTLCVWKGLDEAIQNYLDSVTLLDILKQQEKTPEDTLPAPAEH